MSAEPLLEVRDLTVSFRGKAVVKGVSLDIPKSSWVCLVGETGSGKSLSALSLTRLHENAQVSGRATWFTDSGKTKELLSLPAKELFAMRGKQIAYVFQDPHNSLNPVLTVGEQMVEAYQAHYKCRPAEAEKAALICLSEMRLESKRVFASFPHELSGGMKQRVMIATALLCAPRLLIADEPTTALDVTIEHGIIDLLRDLRTEWPMSYLFITHNISLAARVAEIIYVMKDGQVVERMERGPSASSGRAGFAPKEAYTKLLFSAGLDNVKPRTEIPV
jgi:ABC-type dipeptide/oligopeptide/nickel transport system ATPase component